MDSKSINKIDVEIDLTDQIHDATTEESDSSPEKRPSRHLIYIYNELDGRTFRFTVLSSVPIGKVIVEFYERANRQPDPGDRLTCDGNGEDVLQYRNLNLHEYLERAKCESLEWSFSGPHGGA